MPEFDGTATKRMCVDVSDVLSNVEKLITPTPFVDFPADTIGWAGKTRFFAINISPINVGGVLWTTYGWHGRAYPQLF